MEFKNKKFILIIFIILFLLLVGVGVFLFLSKLKGNNNGDVKNVELVYWGLWEPSSVMQPLIDEYESAHPGVKILYSQQTSSNYESRLFTRLQQASSSTEPAPDIFRVHNTWIPKYYSYLSPLPEKVMTRDQYSQAFYPTALSDFTAKNGKLYAIPLEIDGLVLFYNKQMLTNAGFSEPPKDWDSITDLAHKLTKKNSSGKIIQAGLALGTSRNILHAPEILSFLLLQEGVELIDSTRTNVTLNTAKVESVLNVYTGFATGKQAVWSSDLRYDLEMFYSGKLAMMIAPSWRAFDIILSSPTIEFGMATLPQLGANQQKVYYSTYWGEAVNKSSANTDIAWDFVNFLAQKESLVTKFSNESKLRAFGEPYSLVELNSSMSGNSYLTAIAEMAPYMKSWQMGDETIVKQALNQLITSVVEDGQDLSTALKNAQEDINDQLAQINR